MQQNNLMSDVNPVAGVQKSWAQLKQIGFHTVIQISLESNTYKENLLTSADSPSSFPLPLVSLTERRVKQGGAEIKMNLHLNQTGSGTKM